MIRTTCSLRMRTAARASRTKRVTASGLRAKDGRMNFADLAGEPKAEGHERSEPPKLRVAEMNIERAQLAYRDQASGQELTVGELNLKTGRLDGDAPGPVSFSAHLTGRRPDIDLRAQAGGALRFNLARQEVGLDGVSAQVKGRLDRDNVSVELSAPKVEITPAKASGSAVTATVKLAGPQRNIDAKLKIAAVEGSATALSIPSLALELAGALSGTPLKAQAQGAIKANLQKKSFDADLTAKLDESTIKAKLGATRTDPLNATFDASIDRINLDRYLPAEKKESKADEPIDLSALKGKTVTEAESLFAQFHDLVTADPSKAATAAERAAGGEPLAASAPGEATAAPAVSRPCPSPPWSCSDRRAPASRRC
jgi:AsmA protein